MIWRLGRWLLVLALLVVLGLFVWRQCSGGQAPPPAVALAPRPPPQAAAPRTCAAAPAFTAPATANAASLTSAAWSVFGRPESGWEIYAPLAEREIGTACPPAAPGFAEALASWQRRHGLPPNGIMDAVTLDALRLVWILRRPFVAASARGACPEPPPADRMAQARPNEGYGGEAIWLRLGALDAYRRMAAAARAEVPAVAADPKLLTIFSGYRDPAADATRCVEADDCGTITRARCSAHRTGLAMDLYLGAAPSFPPDSAADANRLFMSRSAAYRWLVANADRFGFVNYPFEPWHWEWTGEPP